MLLSLAPFLMITFLYGPEWLAVPLLLLLGFAAISPQPVIMALVQDQFPLNRALANGTYLAITFLLQAADMAGRHAQRPLRPDRRLQRQRRRRAPQHPGDPLAAGTGKKRRRLTTLDNGPRQDYNSTHACATTFRHLS